jgi:NADPH:quinone reductase-like Zn-dependent oxidoreductase
MQALQLTQPSASPDAIQVKVVAQSMPICGPTEAVVRVLMAAINPSDVKASLGHMPQAVFPRTPGRDYVGVVEQGPKEWLGKTVFGSGGDVGITRDGSHASYLVLPQRALLKKPDALSLTQAASMGVPYVTALDGYAKAGFPQPGQNILIGGAMGKVGLAAAAIAKVYGARVIGIKRQSTQAVPGHACDVLFDLEDPDLAVKLMAQTNNQGFSLFYNTVGSPYLALSLDVLAHKGKQILISTLARDCPFDIFKFFRKEMTFFGVDTLKKDTVASNQLLSQLVPHIDSGRLVLPQEDAPKIYILAQAAEAFKHTFVKGGVGLLNISAS